ncbi:hypothetical protein [Streptomyces sp. NPDC005096]|uniref:hypothetical protein n=1 Tax=Streptomyces sp. NPDC005096 TaxID=3154559 RepID=UPI0033B2F8FE
MSSTTEIRPFTVEFTDAERDDLRRRIEATRFPEREAVACASCAKPARTAAGPTVACARCTQQLGPLG